MVNANIDIFEKLHEQSVSYFKHLESLEKIRCTNGPGPATIQVDNKKRVFIISSVGKPSKNPKPSSMWCHYCDKSKHKMADCRVIAALC
jgi:hypothetical protein